MYQTGSGRKMAPGREVYYVLTTTHQHRSHARDRREPGSIAHRIGQPISGQTFLVTFLCGLRSNLMVFGQIGYLERHP